jgi:hypothetical protein
VSRRKIALAVAGTVIALSGPTASAQSAAALSRPVQEARFLRSVDREKSANLVTGDLSRYTGSRVDYQCAVDAIVRPGVILGQCGSEAEPIDLFVRLPTEHVRVGQRLRILGIMEAPVTWADVMGHTVYYAFLRAVFVDPLR